MSRNSGSSVGYVMLPKQDRRRLGIIGADILSQQNAIIDFGNRKLYLKR